MSHVVRHWIEWEVEGGQHKCVLVAETSLETRPDAPGFDSSEFDDLMHEVLGLDSNAIDRIRVMPTRR